MISIMLDTKLKIRCGNATSEQFDTKTGVPQGDGLSDTEFTFYLASGMEVKQKDHTYATRQSTNKTIAHDHCYS